MDILLLLLLALALDTAFGDPPNRFHPLILMGRWLSFGKKLVGDNKLPTRNQFWFGTLWTLAGIGLFALPFQIFKKQQAPPTPPGKTQKTFFLPSCATTSCSARLDPSSLRLHSGQALILHPLLLKPVLAYRGLRQAVQAVAQALKNDDLVEARRLLSWHLVSRDTSELNKAEVVAPWHKFRKQGNSLFLFRIVLGLISFAVVMMLIAILVVIGIILFAGRGEPNPLPIILMVLLAMCVILPVAIIFGLIGKFTQDFVVPIMFLREGTCMNAWREFWPLLTGNKGKFAIYILFQILIALAVGIVVMACVCITCCCLGCFLAIPYVGTVILLPILVFDRSYSLLYLRQYGTGFDVFASELAPTVVV